MYPKIVGLSDSFDLKSDSVLAPRRKARLQLEKSDSCAAQPRCRRDLGRGEASEQHVKPPEIGEIVFLLEKLVKELIVEGNRVFGCHVSTQENNLRRAFFETDGSAVITNTKLSVVTTR